MIGEKEDMGKLIDAEVAKEELCKMCGISQEDNVLCDICWMKDTIDSLPDCSQCDTD